MILKWLKNINSKLIRKKIANLNKESILWKNRPKIIILDSIKRITLFYISKGLFFYFLVIYGLKSAILDRYFRNIEF